MTIRIDGRALIALLLLVTLAGLAGWRAGTREAATPTAVAAVSYTQIMNAMKEREDRDREVGEALKPFEAQFGPAVLEGLATELKNLRKDLDSLKEGSPEWEAKVLKAQDTQRQFDSKRENWAALRDRFSTPVLRDLYVKITDATARVAARDGWDLVFIDDREIELPVDQGGGVLMANIRNKRMAYASDRVNITDAVITLLNNEYASAPKN